ncbi:hypothetical protein F2Q68_00014148 [Brassica cretica]|uniref:Uncharacterized protein n=1 Tax=Brassica cretica TaxID=69181 RepID=A0A8S9HFA2_BRACR|nr:hypothetical protein F2Q68_00014148 [Brassica cretica]
MSAPLVPPEMLPQGMDLTIPQGPRNRKAWPGLGRATARSVGSRVGFLGLTLEYF